MDNKDLIRRIEAARNSKVICYVTGDRQPFTTRIAGDCLGIFKRHLESLPKTSRISLFLSTKGGDMLAPLSIVKLIRHYCRELEVLVPFQAYSAGTSIALGANKVVMGKMGELSPTDPSMGHPFNPQNPSNPQQRMEVSVEDVNSFFLLAKEKAGVREQEMAQVFNNLAEKIHPLALGSVYRAYRMSRTLTEKLLKLHLKPKRDEKKIQRIVEHLTGLISIHNYPITRDEAKDLGLNIELPTPELDATMWSLYETYTSELGLGEPFNPIAQLGESDRVEFEQNGAYIESEGMKHAFVFSGILTKFLQPQNQMAANINILSTGWIQRP